MKPIVDELSFWQAMNTYVGQAGGGADRLTAREIINSEFCLVHRKRAWRWLEKWFSRDLYTFGVSLDLGWMEEKAEGLDDPRNWRQDVGSRG